jgi:hypothetical protein
MPKPLDPIIEEVLSRYDIDPRQALWDCHGTWVIYHKYVELIGMKAGVTLDEPTIIHADPTSKHVVILVKGSNPEARVSAWSFGEAAPYNNKNAYPFAMAEKRAKDRVILKLVGLAGHVYTDQDVADIKDGKIQWEVKPEQQDRPHKHDSAWDAINNATTMDDLDAAAQRITQLKLPATEIGKLRKAYTRKKEELTNG